MKKDYELKSSHLILGKKDLITEELVLSSGKVTVGDIVDENGAIITDSGKVFGVVARSADATTTATKTVVYVEGEFNINEVNYGNATKETVVKLCRDRNIYLRTLGGKQ